MNATHPATAVLAAVLLLVACGCGSEPQEVDEPMADPGKKPQRAREAPTSRETDGSPRESRKVSESGYEVTPWTRQQREARAEDLEPLERQVTCKAGTEPAYSGRYWDHKADGTYICVICRLPLFQSATKFESGTGWPSFFRPFDPEHVAEHRDTSHGMVRTEVRCARCGAHLGHVFGDGPRPTGQRYCMNSAALDFVAEEEPLPGRKPR